MYLGVKLDQFSNKEKKELRSFCKQLSNLIKLVFCNTLLYIIDMINRSLHFRNQRIIYRLGNTLLEKEYLKSCIELKIKETI